MPSLLDAEASQSGLQQRPEPLPPRGNLRASLARFASISRKAPAHELKTIAIAVNWVQPCCPWTQLFSDSKFASHQPRPAGRLSWRGSLGAFRILIADDHEVAR